MHHIAFIRPLRGGRGILCPLLLCVAPTATAGDLIGLYAGASAGQANVATNVDGFGFGDFRENHSAWKAIAGVHPLLPFGAEIAYIDFGHPSTSVGGIQADVHMKGTAAFAVLYLPVPVVDVYFKAGVAQLRTDIRATFPGVGTCISTQPDCSSFHSIHDRSSYAVGAGAQIKFGSVALRAEYERFDGFGGNPMLASVGIAWTFL
jgi:opacity protein-like surface antigen